jgi:tetratricopeptide (TPR) repeat protein
MKKLFLLFLFFPGCVYYNIFYNAEKYYKEKDYKRSIEKCKKILEKHQDSNYADDAIFLMGKNYYHLGDYDKSKENFKKIIDFSPNSPFVEESYLFLGKIALEKKNLNEAIIFLEKAADSGDPGIRMETFKTKLELYLLTDDPEKTIEEGERFIKEYGSNSEEAYYIIGNANRLMGNKEEAIKMYKKALKEGDQNPSVKVIYNLAELYFEMDSLSRALSVIEEEKNDSCSLLKGEILMKLENLEEATESFESVKKRKDSLGAVAKYHLGEIKEIQGDTSEALKLYKEAETKGDFGEVCEKAQAKKEIFENIFSLQTLAEKKKNKEENYEKKDEEVEQNYERKDSSYMFFRIGELYYWDLGETEKGVGWYRKVHEEFPGSSYAPKAIFTLLNIELNEGSTFSSEANELFSILMNKYPNTRYSEKAKELYGPYFQDTTSSRE